MKPSNRLMTPNLLLLWQGLTVSSLGNQAFAIGIVFWLKHETGSAAMMGMIGMLSGLPSIFFGPIAGAVADRYSRRKILVGADLISGVAVGLLSWALAVEAFPLTGMLALAIAVSLVLGIADAFQLPAFTAAVPDVVHRDRLPAANSVVQASLQGATLVGQAVGGTLFRVLGAPVLFLFDAATFLYSAICESMTTIPQPRREAAASAVAAVKSDTIEGLRYIWKQRGLRELVFGSSILNALTVPVVLLLPFYVEDTLKMKPDWYGFLIGAYSAGTLLGYVAVGALRLTSAARAKLMIAFMVAEGAGPVLLAVIREPLLAMAVFFLAGITGGFISVAVTSILQITTADELRGRVFGILATIAGAISPIAMGISGVIADLLGRNIPLLYVMSGCAMALVALLLAGSDSYRRFIATDDSEPEPNAKTVAAGESA